MQHCITAWQTSGPDRTRSLPMRRFEAGHEYLTMKPALELLRGSAFKKQLDRLPQNARGLLDSRPLARDIQLSKHGHGQVAFTLDNARIDARGHWRESSKHSGVGLTLDSTIAARRG